MIVRIRTEKLVGLNDHYDIVLKTSIGLSNKEFARLTRAIETIKEIMEDKLEMAELIKKEKAQKKKGDG